MKHNSRLGLYLGIIGISIFIILFINNKKPDNYAQLGFIQKLGSYFGLNGYKKGLDIAGGVRLTYKIDLAKYQETYTNAAEYNKVRNNIIDVILKNIDSRISKLGVSDYTSYIQKFDNNEYLIIEIGGLADLEEAKKLIGKTVELEFKLLYETNKDNTIITQRAQMAENLLKETITNPNIFAQLGSGKGSDSIIYTNYLEKKIDELPQIYGSYIDNISLLKTGSIYPTLLSGLYQYTVTMGQDNKFNPIALKGWVIAKFNNKTIKKISTLTSDKLKEVASKYNFPYNEQLIKSKIIFPAMTYQIQTGENNLIYNGGELYSGKEAYDIKLFKLDKLNLIGKTSIQIEDMKKQRNNLIEEVKKLVYSGQQVNLTGVKSMQNGWIDLDTLKKNYLANFNNDNNENYKLLEQADGDYIYFQQDKKLKDEILTKKIIVSNILSEKKDNFINGLETENLYSLEEIYIRDVPTRILAKDPKTNEILNGAFFRYATAEPGQAGKPVVSINFDEKGKQIFCNVTEQYVGKTLAIFVGGNLRTNPVIRSKICGGSAQIDGDFTDKGAKSQYAGAKQLATDLNEGALPAKLILAHEEKVSPTLGEHAIQGAIAAAITGLALVFCLMSYMFNLQLALISMGALGIFLIVLFALIKIIGYSLSLSGISAILLTIGMTVDSSILIFERIREEKALNKNIYLAIEDGFVRSFSAIRDGNLTAGFIGLLLFMIGTNVFKGFGTMILINIFLILFLVVPFTKELLYFISKDSSMKR